MVSTPNHRKHRRKTFCLRLYRHWNICLMWANSPVHLNSTYIVEMYHIVTIWSNLENLAFSGIFRLRIWHLPFAKVWQPWSRTHLLSRVKKIKTMILNASHSDWHQATNLYDRYKTVEATIIADWLWKPKFNWALWLVKQKACLIN